MASRDDLPPEDWSGQVHWLLGAIAEDEREPEVREAAREVLTAIAVNVKEGKPLSPGLKEFLATTLDWILDERYSPARALGLANSPGRKTQNLERDRKFAIAVCARCENNGETLDEAAECVAQEYGLDEDKGVLIVRKAYNQYKDDSLVKGALKIRSHLPEK